MEMAPDDHTQTPDEEERYPFGLTEEVLRSCYNDSADRPEGMRRYEAFAFQMEAAIAAQRVESEAGLYPIVHGYHRLLWHAHRLAGCLGQALSVVKSNTQLDVAPGHKILSEFSEAFTGNN